MTLTKIFLISALAGLIFTVINHFTNKPSNYFITWLKDFVGSFFIFSGIVKAVDPLGTAYKMNDYFVAFGGVFEQFKSIIVPLAVVMIVFELVLGVALIIGYKPKISVWATFLLLVAFTGLTGYTYLSGYINPDRNDIEVMAEAQEKGEKVPFFQEFDEADMKVTDCGCFGDFLKLKPKVSFFKDIFLILVTFILMAFYRSFNSFFPKKFSFMGDLKIAGVTLFSLIFCLSNYVWGLPMVDFRPYKVGNDIVKQLTPEREANIEYLFIYENKETGEEMKLRADELKGLDYSVLKFNGREENVIDPGIPAKIINFYINDEEDNNMNDAILYDEAPVVMMVAYDLTKTKTEAYEDIQRIAAWGLENGLHTFLVTSNPSEEFKEKYLGNIPVYTADGTFLKTIVRSNPGLVIIKSGIVEGKWHWRNLPDNDDLKEFLD